MKSASLLLVGDGWPDLRICWPLPYLLIGLLSGCCWAVGLVECLARYLLEPDLVGLGCSDRAGQCRAEAKPEPGAHIRAHI